jgi:hypothetical protein
MHRCTPLRRASVHQRAENPGMLDEWPGFFVCIHFAIYLIAIYLQKIGDTGLNN